MINIIRLRLKLMYGEKMNLFLSCCIIAMILFLMAFLYGAVEESTKLKIGIDFEVSSDLSGQLYEVLEHSDILLPRIMSKEEGIDAVEQGKIHGYYYFNESIEEVIRNKAYHGFIDLYVLEENVAPYLINELLGSAVLGEIAVYEAVDAVSRAVLAREKINERDKDYNSKSINLDLYRQALSQKGKENQFAYKENTYVNVVYKNTGNGNREIEGLKKVAQENQRLYMRIIWGIVYTLMLFYMMFLSVIIVRDRENGIRKQWQRTPLKRAQVIIGDYISIIIGVLPLGIGVLVIQLLNEEQMAYYIRQNLVLLFGSGLIVYLLSGLFKKVQVYVLGMSVLVIFGFIGYLLSPL